MHRQPTFRHAVMIVDKDGHCPPYSPAIEQLAADLLLEYGHARGGTELDNGRVLRREWDFGLRIAYAMEFAGVPTEPQWDTVLCATPRIGTLPLQDFEEVYVLPAVWWQRTESPSRMADVRKASRWP